MEDATVRTFNVSVADAVAWVTFDHPPGNIQDLQRLADLNILAEKLEGDRQNKVVAVQSTHREIFVAHEELVIGVQEGQ